MDYMLGIAVKDVTRHEIRTTKLSNKPQHIPLSLDFPNNSKHQLRTTMASQATRLSHLFTPTFARAINIQLVHPSTSQVVKPNELESALARPLQKAYYEPESSAAELGASLSFGLIKGHPFLDGNKRTGSSIPSQRVPCTLSNEFTTAFFLGNEYVRAQGDPGLLEGANTGKEVEDVADSFIGVASGQLDVDALLSKSSKS